MKRIVLLLLSWRGSTVASAQTSADTNLRWQPGYFDIHHINTGRGNSTFFIFPDSTTLLLDAGELNPSPFLRKNAPLTISPTRPNASRTAGEWIADYVRQMMPVGRTPQLDYLLVSHFHGDHYGELTERSRLAARQTSQRTGVTEVGDLLTVGTILDRGYPAYDFPTDLRARRTAVLGGSTRRFAPRSPDTALAWALFSQVIHSD